MHPGIGFVGVDAVVELIIEFVALSMAGQVRNSGTLVVFVDAECNYANFVPEFDGPGILRHRLPRRRGVLRRGSYRTSSLSKSEERNERQTMGECTGNA